jgi:hypothetical protein
MEQIGPVTADQMRRLWEWQSLVESPFLQVWHLVPPQESPKIVLVPDPNPFIAPIPFPPE